MFNQLNVNTLEEHKIDLITLIKVKGFNILLLFVLFEEFLYFLFFYGGQDHFSIRCIVRR